MLKRLLWIAVIVPAALTGQSPASIEAERADFVAWLRTSPASPYAAVYHQPLRTDELVLGPGGSSLLRRAPAATLSSGRRGLTLETEDGRRIVPRNRDVALGDWRLRVSGSDGVTVVTVFAALDREVTHPGWFPVDPAWVVEGRLVPPERPGERRMLGLDGVEVRATAAGTLQGQVHGEAFAFTTYRVPVPGSEEADISVFFQDGTSGMETYPPGRFVTLQPLGGDRYRLDFNRARNPFCAYNTTFPCPIPWGNVLEVRVEAGELYEATHE